MLRRNCVTIVVSLMLATTIYAKFPTSVTVKQLNAQSRVIQRGQILSVEGAEEAPHSSHSVSFYNETTQQRKGHTRGSETKVTVTTPRLHQTSYFVKAKDQHFFIFEDRENTYFQVKTQTLVDLLEQNNSPVPKITYKGALPVLRTENPIFTGICLKLGRRIHLDALLTDEFVYTPILDREGNTVGFDCAPSHSINQDGDIWLPVSADAWIEQE